jgi:hypothetical protein
MTTAIGSYTTGIRGVLMFLPRGVAGSRVAGPQGPVFPCNPAQPGAAVAN